MLPFTRNVFDPMDFTPMVLRQGKGRWYVAGINGESKVRKLTLDLGELQVGRCASLFADGDGGNLSFRADTIYLSAGRKLELTVPSRRGLVLVLK